LPPFFKKDMKFKDKVISIFLAGILAYAFCYRNNIIPFRNGSTSESADISIQSLEDTISYKDSQIIANPGTGVTVGNRNSMVISRESSVRAEALHLRPGQVVGADTLNLQFSKTSDLDEVPCLRINKEDSLSEVGK